MVEAVVPYILVKTQHRYPSIREFAFQTLATLILEDYLKFRGTLLIYILAGMLDQQREIKELATELIMKYTYEKSEIFLRTCLLECPFVFNGCPCFGQTTSSVSPSGNILKGPAKRPAREFIYRYLIKKVEPVYLYMYFGNITRLLEYIEKENDLEKSKETQAAVADFLYVCTEICIANEKQKKNVAKIVKETHNADGDMINDSEQPLSAQTNETEEAEMAAVGDASATGSKGRKGGGGKKNMPTIAQALVAVEKIIPTIAVIDDKLRSISDAFGPIIDRLCVEICIHFDTLLEFAQPRSFWLKYQNQAKRTGSIAPASKQVQKSNPARPFSGSPLPSTSNSKKSRLRNNKENDSGRFTIDDEDTDDELEETRSKVSPPSKRTKLSRVAKRSKTLFSSSSGQGDDEDTSPDESDASDSTAPSKSRSRRSGVNR